MRALLHMLQFAVAYFIMLLAMYFNGYIIICIFIGAFLGALIFSWEGLGGEGHRYVFFIYYLFIYVLLLVERGRENLANRSIYAYLETMLRL